MVLLAMVAAMGFLAATEGWLRVSECGEVLPGELPPSAVEETGDWDTGSSTNIRALSASMSSRTVTSKRISKSSTWYAMRYFVNWRTR